MHWCSLSTFGQLGRIRLFDGIGGLVYGLVVSLGVGSILLFVGRSRDMRGGCCVIRFWTWQAILLWWLLGLFILRRGLCRRRIRFHRRIGRLAWLGVCRLRHLSYGVSNALSSIVVVRVVFRRFDVCASSGFR